MYCDFPLFLCFCFLIIDVGFVLFYFSCIILTAMVVLLGNYILSVLIFRMAGALPLRSLPLPTELQNKMFFNVNIMSCTDVVHVCLTIGYFLGCDRLVIMMTHVHYYPQKYQRRATFCYSLLVI